MPPPVYASRWLEVEQPPPSASSVDPLELEDEELPPDDEAPPEDDDEAPPEDDEAPPDELLLAPASFGKQRLQS